MEISKIVGEGPLSSDSPLPTLRQAQSRRLLRASMENAGKAVPRRELLNRVWGKGWVGNPHTLDVHLCWLREKLEEDPSAPQYIQTLRGYGHRFVEPAGVGSGTSVTSPPVKRWPIVMPFSTTIDTTAGYNHLIPFTLALSANNGGYTATLAFTVTTRSSEEIVAGTIATHTVWTSDKTYVVNANVGIAPGVTLTIQPGTVVKFNGNYALNVGGTLVADGTAAQPIVFMPYSTGTWSRIYFDDPSSDAVVDGDGTYRSGTILRYVEN